MRRELNSHLEVGESTTKCLNRLLQDDKVREGKEFQQLYCQLVGLNSF
jgi:hypothetical protein